jgi:curli biogenesis system outer membrane secretion channel CsgG
MKGVSTPRAAWALVVACDLVLSAHSARAQATESIQTKATNNAKLRAALVVGDVTKTRERDSGPSIRAAFEDAMIRAGRFITLSREAGALDKEQRLAASGAVDPASAAKLGKILSANYVLVVRQLTFERGVKVDDPNRPKQSKTAAIKGFFNTNIDYTFTLQAQAVDVETGEIVQSESYARTFQTKRVTENQRDYPEKENTQEPQRALLDSVAIAFTSKLAAAIPLKAVVVLIRDANNIAISAGADAGLRVGARFELVEEGQAIKGPGGEILGYDSRTVGQGEVTRVDAKLAWLKLLSTVAPDGTPDGTPNVSRVKQYLTAKMVGLEK